MWTPPDKFLQNEAITQEQRPHLDTLLRKALRPSAPVDGEPLPEEARALIQKLVDADVLESVDTEGESFAEQYTLTEKGKLLAMPLLKLVKPRRAHVPRQVKLTDMTAWELFNTLLRRCFKAEATSKSKWRDFKKADPATKYIVLRRGKQSFYWEYLFALAKPFPCVPHLKTKRYYGTLVYGGPLKRNKGRAAVTRHIKIDNSGCDVGVAPEA